MPAAIAWDTLEGMPAASWVDHFRDVEHRLLVHAVADAVRALVLPRWLAAHPGNRQPARALDAAVACVQRPSENGKLHALAVAKACSKERERTFGYEHRIAESARALAWAAARTGDDARREALAESLGKLEEELVTHDAVAGIYGREREHRARMLALLRARLEAG